MFSFDKDKFKLTNFFSAGEMRTLSKWQKYIFLLLGILMSAFQIWSVIFANVEPITQMAIHLSFILMLTFFLYRSTKLANKSSTECKVDSLLVFLAAGCGVYYLVHADRIATRVVSVDLLTTTDIIFGLLFVILCIEAARRTIGFTIIGVALIFIVYTLYGHMFDGILYHRKMSFVEVLDQLAFSFNGLWGSPISVAATFVFMFVLFGSFLQKSGASEFFFNLSVSVAGRTRGGAAKIAVIASAFFGAISGSPTANVVTTGSFTIPMAKKAGYSPRFAAAVEACSSTGGSILPPIMGSSAFLMAAVTGIDYKTIAIAAILPALLFYFSLFLMIHFEAIRLDLPRSNKQDIPRLGRVLKDGWYYFIPVIILIFFLLKGFSPSRTGFYGLLAVVIVSWFSRDHKMGPKQVIRAMAHGAKSAIPISTACAAAGLIIAGIMTTGLGGKLSSIILGVTSGKLFPSLLLIMVMCIVLGLGMPVAAAYVLTAMLAAPTLINLGVSVLGAHLFIVYFSIISAITPPVAVASFAAAGIARTNPAKVGIEAVRLGIVSFIIPFIFIFNPALLMDGTIIDIALVTCLTIAGITLLCWLLILGIPTSTRFVVSRLEKN